MSTPPVKRACTECRQQKARCDAYLDPDNPCTRCRKMDRQCIISEPFKREHKRKRMSELEHQTDALQERLRSSSQPDPSSWTAVNTERRNDEPESRLASVAPFFRDAAIAPVSFRSFSQAAETLQTPESLPRDQGPTSTLPRSLEGVTVEPKDIDAIFQIYFRDHARLMPLLDPAVSPNAYYALCPFLFWAIVGVGCRTYPRNPTLLGVLPAKIQSMALLNLNVTPTLETVQGMLLLLCWPFPKLNNTSDMTFPLGGALLHMAMALGLHVPVSSQEFSKIRIKLTQEEAKKRAETWGYSMLLYQRVCQCKGSPATPVLEVPYELDQRRALFQNISPRLKFELKLQDVVTRFSIAVSQNGLRVMSVDQERALDTLINVFQSQIASVGLEYASDLDHLYVQLATLSIQAFNLYKSPTSQDPTSLYDLCATACQVIESFDNLDRTGQIALPASTLYFYFNLMITCHVLLRMLKTSFARYIDVERAKAGLFLGISLQKRMSLQNDDLPARSGAALTELWNSHRVFRRPDGTEAVALRIRSRLCGSLVLDGIVWRREEFGGFVGVYAPPLPDTRSETAGNESVNPSNTTTANDSALAVPAKQDSSSILDDPMLAEFGWPLGDDIFSSLWLDGPVPST